MANNAKRGHGASVELPVAAQKTNPLGNCIEDRPDTIFRRNQLQSPLLRLPGELRNRIYEYALVQQDGIHAKHCRKHMSLTRVSRQLRAETHLLFFKLNTFKFRSRASWVEFVKSTTVTERKAVHAIQLYVFWIDVFAGIYLRWRRQPEWAQVLTSKDFEFGRTFPELEKVHIEMKNFSEMNPIEEAAKKGRVVMEYVRKRNKKRVVFTHNIVEWEW